MHSYANALAAQGGELYAAGREYIVAFTAVAKIWKLSDGTETALTDGTYFASALALAVHGGELYAAGYERNGSDIDVAKVWKLSDGAATALTDGTYDAYAKALAAQGGELYAAGWERNGPNGVATVWKLSGGTWTSSALSDGTKNAQANAILLAWE
jgi:hypothetical protein